MAKNQLIDVHCFGKEVGRIGLDPDKRRSFFQYHPDFLQSDQYSNLFPATGILKRVENVQVFSNFFNDTFQGLPPMFADSLPDAFGNIIFQKWLEKEGKSLQEISPLEQLAYVGTRGMGALEYHPVKEIPAGGEIDLKEIIAVLEKVLDKKAQITGTKFNEAALLHIFKMGTSAGGARPKLLIAQHKETGIIIPGDIARGVDYDHYLVKLSLEENNGYRAEWIEYSYYRIAKELGIQMMPSNLIDGKHFATLRFDRQNGRKKHVLTASGLSGWDFKQATNSSYENLFELALFLKVPHKDIEELFRRMVFNVVYQNTDDHLKNHSFIYDESKDSWQLAPAYDLTYALNPLLHFKSINRALSINHKRQHIQEEDLLKIAATFTVKNARTTLQEIRDSKAKWRTLALEIGIEKKVVKDMFPK